GPLVNIQVTRNGAMSNAEPVTMDSTAPSVYFTDYDTGAATLAACQNGTCAMWGNGFGPKNTPSQDGVGAPLNFASLQDIETRNPCTLSIAGLDANVIYCGDAPGIIIDQIVFTFPTGLPANQPWYDAALTIGGVTGHFRIPPPPK